MMMVTILLLFKYLCLTHLGHKIFVRNIDSVEISMARDSSGVSQSPAEGASTVSNMRSRKSTLVSRSFAPFLRPNSPLNTTSNSSDSSPGGIFKAPRAQHRRATEFSSAREWTSRLKEESGRWDAGRSLSLDGASSELQKNSFSSDELRRQQSSSVNNNNLPGTPSNQYISNTISLGFLLNSEAFSPPPMER
jgi:hypothetical protein